MLRRKPDEATGVLTMFKLLGFGDLSSTEAWTVGLAAVALALIVGWLLDLIADHIGFGIFGNAVICLLGIAVGIWLFRTYVGEVSMQRLPMVMGVAAASVIVHMFVLIFLRRALKL
jgi:uncharacterized membrane protein YeaQ/YmgE (transglycosylase-associated protein family)